MKVAQLQLSKKRSLIFELLEYKCESDEAFLSQRFKSYWIGAKVEFIYSE